MTVSIALCTYQGEEFIGQQITSFLNQTILPNEIVICDDGSNDKTLTIIQTFNENYPDLIKLYINKKNLGGRKNFEKALKLCTGDIIFLSDQDDLWLENKIEKIIAFLDINPQYEGVFTNASLMTETGVALEGTLLDYTFFNQALRNTHSTPNLFFWSSVLGNIITGATIAIRKTALQVILPFRLDFRGKELWHDTWIGFRLLANNSMAYIDECLIKYRIHSKQQVGIDDYIEDLPSQVIFNRKVEYSPNEIKVIYLRLLHAILFIKYLKKDMTVNCEVEERITVIYKRFKGFYFGSQSFVTKKARLLKWYLHGNNDISLKDLILL